MKFPFHLPMQVTGFNVVDFQPAVPVARQAPPGAPGGLGRQLEANGRGGLARFKQNRQPRHAAAAVFLEQVKEMARFDWHFSNHNLQNYLALIFGVCNQRRPDETLTVIQPGVL
jgi:hypothetical protein